MTEDQKYSGFANRLNKVYKHIGKIAKKKGVSCFRVYDLDMPDFPFLIDYYAGKVYVSEYERNHQMDTAAYLEWLEKSMSVVGEVFEVLPGDIHIKTRKSIKERQDQYEKIDSKGNFKVVEENGLKFLINLTDYLDTGLFLDHRPTRKMVQEQSKDKKVLNLFAYTGSFSVYAAAGGASEVWTIDMSKTYIDWAKENMELNGYKDFLRYKFIQGDVLQELRKLPANYFDIIVLDPPTFSNSKRMDQSFDVQRDHVDMIKKCQGLLTNDGMIYFSTNYTKFKLDEAELAGLLVKDITGRTRDFDFERKLNRQCFLITKSTQ
ncbi:MAG: class I SAM-dependent methyltransferase [Saprospiraceae bacterium]|nr:class I SAM-dependent methyltransferase [Saprospiraceae bacterium]